MARVISDTGIPDKSVGDRADRGYASHAQIHRICARQSACRAPIFPSLPSSPLHANLPVIIASRRLTRPVEIGIAFEDRTARIINGIGSNRFPYTITVTVTVMEEGGDNDGGNSDSSIFAELATQYRSDILRHLGRMDEKGSIVGNLCRLIKSNPLLRVLNRSN